MPNSPEYYQQIRAIIEKTYILKSPDRRIATFGSTRINYFFLSEIKGFKDRCRLREGLVLTEKPKIITRDSMKERFEGFGADSRKFARWLDNFYGDSLRGLEYKFRNEPKHSHVEKKPLPELAETLKKRLRDEEARRSAVISGPDESWNICLMKYIVDECLASYGGNIRELEEHGMFDSPETTLRGRKDAVEALLKRAQEDRTAIPLLERKLNEFGLFKDYEDAFFELFKG